jgi:hypothetical protein|tara:strand:- start:213 stop:413 length:201 start_codon:yes stop_codon:yes gene_type:complete
MVDQYQDQLKQQVEPDNFDGDNFDGLEDKGAFFGSDEQLHEESRAEDVFLPTTGSTCTAQFNEHTE